MEGEVGRAAFRGESQEESNEAVPLIEVKMETEIDQSKHG